jgi:hypothetical protein
VDPAPDIAAIESHHFPIRTFAQLERKVLRTGIGYELLKDRGPGTGCDQLKLLEMHRQRTLRDHYEAGAVDPSQIHAGGRRAARDR